MRIIKAVRFDGSEDSHIIRKFETLESWTGIWDRPEDDPDRKAFRRIRGNAADIDDVSRALVAALRAADVFSEEAETAVCPFPEIPGRQTSVEADWRDGLREAPGRIRREVESLRDLVEDQIGPISGLPERDADLPNPG